MKCLIFTEVSKKESTVLTQLLQWTGKMIGHPPLPSPSVLLTLQMYTSAVPKPHRGTQGVTANSQGCRGIFYSFEGNTAIFNSRQTPYKLRVQSSSQFQYEMTLHNF